MRKLRVITITLLIALTFSMLPACSNGGGSGGGDSSGSGSSGGDNGSNNDTSSAGSSGSGGMVDGVVDLSDDSNYFVIVSGIRYDLNTTVQDVLNDGYSTRKAINLDYEADPGSFVVEQIRFLIDDEVIFAVQAGNRTDNPLPLSQCTLKEMEIKSEWFTDASSVGGLTFGSSKDDIIALFGEPSQMNSDSVISYSIGDGLNRTIVFHLDETGIVSIRLTVYK